MMDTNKYKTYEYSTGDPETGSWCKVYELDKALRAIKVRNMNDIDRIRRLEEENKKLKEENYKDEEMAAMKARLDKMQEDYYRGFPISEEEKKKIEGWKNKHDRYVHMIRSIDDRLEIGGSIGGRYKYEFIPTSIGTIGVVKCRCGEQFVFRDIV